MLTGLPLMGLAFLLCSMAQSLWHLYILYLLMGTFNGITGAIVCVALLSKWFIRKRGLAVGVALSGMYIGSIAIIPLVSLVAVHFGWRATYLLAGFLVLAVGIPLTALVIKDTPQQMGLLPDGEKHTRETSTIREADTNIKDAFPHQTGISTFLKRLPLWLIVISFPLAAMGNVAIIQHEFAFVTDIGIPSAIAASAFGFTMGLSGIGGFLSGWMADRISPRYVSIIFLAVSITGVLLLMRVSGIASLWLFVIVFGLASGVPGILLPLVIGDVFGSANLAVIFGFANILFTFGFAAGVPLAGYIFDANGSYSLVFVIVLLLYIASIVTLYFAYGLKPLPWHRR
jgi:OFA family oxalate/formate antiporter-like MFS transporter